MDNMAHILVGTSTMTYLDSKKSDDTRRFLNSKDDWQTAVSIVIRTLWAIALRHIQASQTLALPSSSESDLRQSFFTERKGRKNMERSLNSLKAHDGLLKIGFVSNLRGGAYLKELQDALTGTDEEPTAQEIRNRANASEIISLNYSGYEQDSKGKKVEESKAQFKAFNSGYKNASGEDIYG